MNQREPELFKLSQDMRTLVHNVSARLGFLYDLSIGKKQIAVVTINVHWYSLKEKI